VKRPTLALRTRLTVFYTLVFGALLTVIAAASYRALADQLDSDATASLIELTSGLHGYLRIDNGVPVIVYDDTDPEEAAFVQRATRYYQVYDAQTGSLLVQSDALAPLGLTFTPAEVKSFRDQPRLHDIDTDYGRVRLSNSIITEGSDAYLLQVGISLAGIDNTLGRFLTLLLWGVPAGLLVAMITGRWLASVALAPITRLAAAARTVDVTNPRQRLPVRGAHDELDAVAHAFNETLARVENVMGEMRQFSTALAHELRTPVAALRGEIELAAMRASADDPYKSTAVSQLEELDKLKRLIDQLLTLARAESGQIPLVRQPVALGPLVASVVEQVEAVAQAKNLTLDCKLDDHPVVEGDPEWLERMLLNLLDNAFKFTGTGGHVVVRLSSEDGMARLEVRDTGIGMSPDVVPHVMERFYRADPARSSSAQGVGLGLSLVKWIAERHNGTIGIESQPSQGSAFVVKIKKI
jgi:two-component system OmpR family sensor kinase